MSAVSDTYFSISAPSEGLYKDRGSRFIAFARPVEREEEVREFLESVRREYHDARHHCYAFRLGLDGATWRASDDGEPSGSAGRQILGQIDSAGLSDVLVVVVRYFGGIKLGVPGLIKAYKESTADALSKAVKVEKAAGRGGVVTTPTGLQYKIIAEGSDVKAGPADTVWVNYKGTLLDGTVFDQTAEGADPVRMNLNRVIPGWTEGLQLVGEGGEIELYIPSDLAYGEQGNQGIEPNSTLIFNVKVSKVGKFVAAPEEK
ncbi:MAG: YigZ family protein [Bacteroidales bacterium]|nr:YigZ family protein [Bacteroidales bacterium]